MAITINENPMNPVPLWDSKNKWQCNQKTFHDAMAWPVVQNGVLPKMALTIKGIPPAPISYKGKIKITECGWSLFNRTFIGPASSSVGTNTLTFEGIAGSSEVAPPDPMPQVIITPQSQGEYKIVMRERDRDPVSQQTTYTDYAVTKQSNGADVFSYDELVYGDETYKIEGTEYTFKTQNADLNYHGSKLVSISVKKFADNATVITTTKTLSIVGCIPYYSSDRVGCMWLGGDALTGSYEDGVYYIELRVDNINYYSEPFLWLTNLSNYTAVTFRRSDVIFTKTNYIDFKDYDNNTYHNLSMYLPNIPQRPPYQFNPEVTDIDGRKFAEKQVSYYNLRIAFNCYEAFLDAIRLLWHCDIRYMGNRRIDYMEPPEMDWNTDNHLCDVVLEMSNYDDVLQTNGTASSYFDSSDSSHQSYDTSFDASFD